MGSDPGCATKLVWPWAFWLAFLCLRSCKMRMMELILPASQVGKKCFVKQIQTLYQDSETTVAYMFHLSNLFPFQKWAHFFVLRCFWSCADSYVPVWTFFLRAEVKVLLQMLLSQSCPLPIFTIVLQWRSQTHCKSMEGNSETSKRSV